jgi:hypothetical protein
MITVRKSADRGTGKYDWLDSKHTFSFGHYHDEKHMAFGPLRVINEDIVAAGTGFDTHGHRDMEILTYVLSGELEHKDSLGSGGIIRPGEVQRMSAGSGIQHSERNPSATNPVHFLQIWIIPDKAQVTPSYEQKDFSAARKPGQLTLLASNDGRNGSLSIYQDAEVYVLDLAPGQSYTHALPRQYKGWAQVARGDVTINGHDLNQGDGASSALGETLEFSSKNGAEILVFNMTKY